MKILHISDTHFLADYSQVTDGFAPSLAVMESPLSQLETLLKQVNSPVDLLIHTGDMTHSGGLSDYQMLRQGLHHLFGDTPLVVTPGNHDDGDALRTVFPEREAVVYGVQVLAFDSAHMDYPNGLVTADTCREILHRQNPDLPLVLCTHHHLLPSQFELPSAQTDPLLQEVLSLPNLVAVLTGHTHHSFAGLLNGAPYFSAHALSFVVDRLDNQLVVSQHPGLSVYEVEDGTLTAQVYSGARRKLGML